MRSLRASLVMRTALLLASTLSIAAVTIYLLMRASLISEFDAALLVEARSLTSHVEQSGREVSLEFQVGELPDYARSDHPHYFEIWSHGGQLKGKSQSVGDQNLERPSGLTEEPVYSVVALPNGLAGRQVAFHFNPRVEDDNSGHTPDEQALLIVVARDTAQFDSMVGTLAGLLLLVTASTVIGSLAILRHIVGKGLQPLNTLASSIERVGTADLSERVQIDNAPHEMNPVVQRLNDLLSRLDDTLAREKSFTADVAHELRTPLAGLQTALEVCVSQRREPQEYQRVIEQCLRVTGGMHSMVDDLLVLARADAHELAVAIESVEVSGLVQECWSPYAAIATDKALDVQWVANHANMVQLDREKSRLVLKNLFENAVAHCGRSGWVRTTIAIHGTQMEISIANNGCTLRQADVVHLFDRFWRGDEARSDVGLHCGLGLSLCQKLMDVLGGSIAVQVEDGVFSVRAAFPIPPAGSQISSPPAIRKAIQ